MEILDNVRPQAVRVEVNHTVNDAVGQIPLVAVRIPVADLLLFPAAIPKVTSHISLLLTKLQRSRSPTDIFSSVSPS